MPRNNGVYIPPAGTKGVPNTTIQSAPYNAFVDDLAFDANSPRPVTAGGTGASNATTARTNLDVYSKAETDEATTGKVNKSGDTMSGRLTLAGGVSGGLQLSNGTGRSTLVDSSGRAILTPWSDRFAIFTQDGQLLFETHFTASAPAFKGHNVWHAGFQGTGTGMDADLLDGFHASHFLPASSYTAGDVFAKVLAQDGAGSGLDADLLDGQQGSYYTDISARLGYTPANAAGQAFTGRVSVPAGAASSQGLAIGGTLIGEISDILRIRPPGARVRYETPSGTPYFDVDANTGIANLFGNREVVNSATFASYLPGNIANMGAGALGTYAMAVNPSGGNIAFGDTVSGSNIAASNSWGAGSGSLSGSWRCMGRTVASNSPDRTTLWLRIS